MMFNRIFSFLGWPIATGLLAAALIFIFVPELRPKPISLQFSANPPATNTRFSYADAVDHAASSVVNIYSRKAITTRRHPLADHPLYKHLFDNAEQDRAQSALGSGVIVSKDGYLLTNNHVIDGADEILALLHDGRRASATFVGNDPESDLAVLKIELDNLTPIIIGDPKSARVGDITLAIGNPFGVGQTVTQGIVSALSRYGLGISIYENYIQTDAAINPGNSGGALIDVEGKLLGINAAIILDTVGIGFAVPADEAMLSLRDIIQYGHVVRGWLGLDVGQMTPEIANNLNIELSSTFSGVRVNRVYLKNPAHLAGIRPNDVITHINDQPIGSRRQGLNKVSDLSPGTTVIVKLLRPQADNLPAQELILEAVVGERPAATGLSRT